MSLNQAPKARIDNLVVQEFSNESLIYDLKTNKAYCLNETSALIWQFCDGNNSVDEIANMMSRKLKTKVSEDFVWLAIEELKKDKLLEKNDRLDNHFNGLSRREIVKKVGLTSMAALPLISSVMAPSAVMAQSCSLLAPGSIIPNFCSSSTPDCNANVGSQCCSGMAISVSQPCPLVPMFNSACACV